jgi:hypothetical protein
MKTGHLAKMRGQLCTHLQGCVEAAGALSVGITAEAWVEVALALGASAVAVVDWTFVAQAVSGAKGWLAGTSISSSRKFRSRTWPHSLASTWPRSIFSTLPLR